VYKTVIVPLDGSQFAESALEHVAAVAQVEGLEKVILLRVVMPLLVQGKSFLQAEHAREAEDKQEAAARQYLKKIASRLRKQRLPAQIKLVVNGEPALKILEAAREENADLIVMSTHGSSGVAPWLFGSVTHRVLSHSPVPVLMVVPQGTRAHKW
jgi:nucleotide-binding universal stress UspA family protein